MKTFNSSYLKQLGITVNWKTQNKVRATSSLLVSPINTAEKMIRNANLLLGLLSISFAGESVLIKLF